MKALKTFTSNHFLEKSALKTVCGEILTTSLCYYLLFKLLRAHLETQIGILSNFTLKPPTIDRKTYPLFIQGSTDHPQLVN
jgi:hypothetical protein